MQRAEEPAVEKRKDAVDAREELGGVFRIADDDADVREALLADAMVLTEAVSADRAATDDMTGDEAAESCAGGGWNGSETNTADGIATALDRAGDQHFLAGQAATAVRAIVGAGSPRRQRDLVPAA